MEVLTKPSKVVATASEILNHSCWSEQLDRRRTTPERAERQGTKMTLQQLAQEVRDLSKEPLKVDPSQQQVTVNCKQSANDELRNALRLCVENACELLDAAHNALAKAAGESETISQPHRGARRNAETTEATDSTHSAVRKG